MAITSHYVSRLRAGIGADLHRDFLQVKYNWSDQQWSLRAEIGADLHRGFLQVKYNWNDQQWCHIAWDSFEMVARRTQTKESVNHILTRK